MEREPAATQVYEKSSCNTQFVTGQCVLVAVKGDFGGSLEITRPECLGGCINPGREEFFPDSSEAVDYQGCRPGRRNASNQCSSERDD